MEQPAMGDMPADDASSVPPQDMAQQEPMPEMPEEPMGNDIPNENDPVVQGIIDNLNKLGDKGKKTADKYVQSLVDMADNDEPSDMPQGEEVPAPMAESFIFSKKQLEEMHKIETGLPVQGELEKQKKPKSTIVKPIKKEYKAPNFK